MKNFNLIEWLWKTDSHEKQSPQRFARYAAMLIMLLTLGVGQMWAGPTFNGGYAYFYNKGGWTDSYKQLCIGKNDYTSTYTMTPITNTKLWYNSLITSGWGDATYMAVVGNGSSWGAGSWGPSNLTNANHRTGSVSLGDWGFGSGNVNMLTPANGNNDAALTLSYIGNSSSSLNITITIAAKVSTDNGGSYSASTAHGKLTGSSKTFSNYTTCGTSSSATLSDGSSSTTMSCGYTATTVLTAADKSGYTFKGWYDSGGSRLTTNKSCTIYVTSADTYYAYYNKVYSIAASSTVVWDLCGNEKSWSAVYLFKDIEGGSSSNDAFTQCGTTTQYAKNYASAVSNMKVFLFRNNTSNWNDYTQTTDLYRDVSGVTLYEFDNTYTGTKLNWQVTENAKKATSGTKVYFDNTNANWGEVWLKYGTSRFNRHTGAAATKVTGTANLYVITMPEAYYVNWYFASSYGWTDRNNISDTHVGNRIPIQSTDLTSDITFVPSGSTSGSSPTQYAATSFTGHTRRLTFGSHTNGNITVRYTDESGVEQTVSSASASYVDVAQTCQVIITAVPNSGFAPSTLTLGGAGITSGAQQIIRADATIAATFVAEETHDVTVSYKYGTRSLHDAQTFEVGVTSASDISAEAIDGFSFSNWSNLTNVTNNSANLTTNPININTIVSGSDGSMTCNYTPWTCSLDIVPSEGATGHSSRTAMSYDATEKAYYINRTTTSATERYRFFINSIEYSTSSNTELTIDETKVNANTNVTNYASDKPSVYFNDGPSGSNITIWFDYENKKAWVTETTYTVTVSAGAGGSVDPTSVSGVGAMTTSGDITAIPSKGYVFTGWTLPSGTSAAGGYSSSSNPIRINATAASKTITANFAAATAFIEGRFHVTNASRNGTWTNTFSAGDWDENSTRIKFTWDGTNSRFYLHTYATPKELTTQISSLDPVFYIKTSSSSSSLANVVSYWSATSQQLSAAGTGNKRTLAHTGTLYNDRLKFNSSTTSGYAVIYFDESHIWYELEQRLQYNGNSNTGGSAPTGTYGNNTYHANGGSITAPENTYSKTGYHFTGWKVANAGDLIAAGSSVTMNADKTLYAQWEANDYTVTLDVDEDHKGTIAGATTRQDVTYNGATTTVPNRPTAANGYALDGYYTDHNGGGTKLINGDGTWLTVAGYTDGSKRWIHDGDVTLYAYYKKAEITGITFSPGTVVENNSTVTVTATISPTPTGTTTVCWRVLYNDTGNPLDPQPTFTPSAQGNSVSFTAPEASGMYKVEAKLRTGSTCGAGTLLDTEEASFQVAGSHTVTVAYKHSSTTIKASTSVTGRPLDWSDPITAPEIFGYTFDHWTAGDGITLSANGSTPVGSDESSANPIYIKAIYNGTLTANYTPKNLIYFKDNLEWTNPEDADAHIYVNLLTGDYWNTDNGSGNEGVTNRNLQMDRVPGTTDVFYYDYGNKTTSNYISFTKESMDNYTHFYQASTAHVVFPSRSLDALGTNNPTGLGFYAATPMFVPLATQTPVKKNDNHATYYNDGYWTKYLPGTGYTLQIYNAAGNSLVKEIAFTSADELMPMKVVTDLEGSHTYKFQLKRDGDVYYGNNGTMTYADHGQSTAWDFYNNSPFNMCTIVTNAAGNYTFNLSYSPNSGGTQNRLRMSVDYPVASGDYRLIYTDGTRSGRIKPSAIVTKENNSKDTVSFFIRPANTPVLKIQQATVNPSTGAISWGDYRTISSSVTGLPKASVYNICLTMDGSGAITVENVEGYTGNYYIRTDAANSKWDNYRTDPDHLMTYSDYLKSDVGYTHYYTHWVNKDDVGRKNVKFVIANDYSPCISDTLARETATGMWAHIGDWMEEGGDLKRNANVRFMWDIETNAISRAYVDGAQEDGSEFLLLLSSDSKIKQGETVKTQITFSDNGNWIYEANVKAQTEARYKLKSTWGDTGNAIVQYFKGSSSETETLIGGSGDDWYDIRLIYDFKTNRLVASYVPATGTINTEIPINADVMFIREHQGDIAQLTFTGSGAISEIKTAYGVLRFNKWTINNKSKSAGHAPLSPELSRYERDLFYISFPFRVNLEEVFGFGTYGTHWIIEYYDGAARAREGFWADTPTFWRFITNRKGVFLEPNVGYLLALDLDELGESSSVWAHTDQVELYFPSYGSMPDIKSSSVTHTLPEHECTIGPRFEGGDDRRIKDSHWNIMAVPTYINTNNVSFANTDWSAKKPNFLYEWNTATNTLTARSAAGYTYKAMHAYTVQYCGNVTWTTSVSPASIVAHRTYAEAPSEVEFRIEIQQNENMIDQTFVRMSDDKDVDAEFVFGEDMSKDFNKNQANIYTMVTTLMEDEPTVTEVAGNCLPMSEQTTVVPMGIMTPKAGAYTIAIPSGTSGVGVTLIDNETGIRTNLALMDYTVDLDAATYDDRFVLEISPMKHLTTDIEGVDDAQDEKIRKVLIDQQMYIIKDKTVFDARGARVK